MDYAGALSIPHRDLFRKIIPSPTLNLVAKEIFEDIEANVGKKGKVLIVGSGEGGEGLSGFSDKFMDENVVGLDIRNTDFSEVLGDIHDLPMKDQCFDAVICQATLEHITNIGQAFDEITRVTKIDGYIYIDVPFIQGHHALPTDYRRFTSKGLKNDLVERAHLTTLESGTSKGPTSAVIWIIIEYFAFLFSFGNYRIRKVISVVLRIITFWVKYIDIVLMETHGLDNNSMSIPSAVYWYGQKIEVE